MRYPAIPKAFRPVDWRYRYASKATWRCCRNYQAWLDQHPEIWPKAGDLAWHAEEAVLGLAAGSNLLLKESIRRKMAKLKAELAGPSPSPLEQVLVDRIAVCWAQTHYADVDAAAKDRGATPLAVHAQRRLSAAQQRYLAAIKQLAVVRKLLRPAPSALDLLAKPVPETNGAHPGQRGAPFDRASRGRQCRPFACSPST